MNQYQKWILTGIFASSVSLLSADQPGSAKTGSKSQMSSDDMKKSDGMMQRPGEITPPAGPRVDAGARFLMTADFIYWQMKQDNLGFGLDGTRSYVLDNAKVTEGEVGKVGKLDFNYKPGFKVGAGVLFDHDNWDLFANYTWLHQNSARGTLRQVSSFSTDLVGSVLTGTETVNTSAKWTAYFNNIDLELGRSFYISRRLVMRPHMGLKAGWMSQRFNIWDTIAASTTSAGVSSGVASLVNQKKHRQSFWGIGLRAGLNTAWHFTRDWSIYGNVAVSELSSRFKVTRNLQQTDLLLDLPVSVTDSLRKSFHIMRPVFETALGLRFETLFSKDQYQFFIQAGWEQQIWLDQNQFIRTSADNGSFSSSAGELTMQGLDVKLGFAF